MPGYWIHEAARKSKENAIQSLRNYRTIIDRTLEQEVNEDTKRTL